jgi:hypothetical protein
MTFLEEYGTIFAFEPLQVVFLGLEFERSDLYMQRMKQSIFVKAAYSPLDCMEFETSSD